MAVLEPRVHLSMTPATAAMNRSRGQAEAKAGKRTERLWWWSSSLVRPSGSAGSIHLRPQKSQLPASLQEFSNKIDRSVLIDPEY